MLGVEVFPADVALSEVNTFARQYSPDAAIVSSVAIPAEEWAARLAQEFHFVTALTAELPLPFINTYTTPHTLGKDRLAAVAGAQAFFPSSACVVVDCGTCIKYEVLHADGRYLGGNISPGLQMRTRAMHTFTARLPEVPLHFPEAIIGNSTTTALQNGAFGGAVLEILGFVARFESILSSEVQVILTGGDAIGIQPHLLLPRLTVEPYLTLIGLNHILIHNQK